MRIRPLEVSDWPTFLPILQQVAHDAETYAMDPEIGAEAAREYWSGAHLVIAVEGGETLGSATMGPNRDAQGSHVGTASFMVAGRHRGSGVGRALGEYVVGWHRQQGFRAIQFNAVVETNTSAVRLWKSLGFAIIGTVPEAFRRPDGSYVGLHVMHLPLVSTASGADGRLSG